MTAFQSFAEAIRGERCLALFAQTYVHQGELVEATNVLFVQVASTRWLRFGIDAGHFHWREVALMAPIPPSTSDAYPLVDLAGPAGITGRHVATVELKLIPPMGATMTLAFAEGGTLALVNTDDISRVEFGDAVV